MSWKPFFVWTPFAVFALTLLVFVRPLHLRVRAQAIWTMVLLLAFSKFLCFAELGGDAFNPELPVAVIWAWDWLYSGAMILCALAVPAFFLRFRRKAWILPVLAWGMSVWGLVNGIRVPAVRELELAFPNLPPSLDGYRVVQISDLHCSSAMRRWRTQAVVDIANALQPDLVCMTGDNADGRVETVAREVEPIRRLRARDGVLACTGNHEYYFCYEAWIAGFYSAVTNIRQLTNACAFPRPGLAVAGVPDESGWKVFGVEAPPDVPAAFAAATNGEFRILLQHRPEYAEENLRTHGVDLQLSGHTHGGIAPVFRTMIAWMNGGFVRGLYRLGDAVLYVSPGTGQWEGFPMRFFNASELTLFTLRRKTAR